MPWKRLIIFWLSAFFMVGAMSAGVAADLELEPTERTAIGATKTDLDAPTPMPPAEDITMDSALNGYAGETHPMKMRDGIYKTYWESMLREGAHSLTITAPAGKTIGGVLIRWKSWPVALVAQVRQDDGWEEIAACDADFIAQYLEIPGVQEIRLISRDDNGRTKLEISEITILTPGELPSDIQVWRKAPEKVDMLLLATHPDDEVLWFGGLLATYAGEQGKDVLVTCGAHNNYYRRLELCDCLWAMGVDIYPEFLRYYDATGPSVNGVFEAWGGRRRVVTDLVMLLRQYKPDVLVLQAVEGESGHPAHKALSLAGREAVEDAATETEFPESAETYGTWDVPKVYVHLWEEDQIIMDWHVPLARFGGLDGMAVAEIGYSKHLSQQEKSYYSVHDGGDTDCSLFGLYRTTVGPDVEKNDMFENIPVRGE